jgi:crossover junction endonuclease MUS81
MSQPPCANPLLLQWVKEWWDTARERNSKGVTTYKHAYDSLKACPITFEHPASLQQLRGFGPKLCERLTEKLRAHCEANGLPMPPYPGAKKRAAIARQLNASQNAGGAEDDDDDDDADPRPAKKARKPKPYVPAYRSGAYALVLALANAGEGNTGLSKPDLIAAAQPYCDASFTAPSDPTKFYTAWNSMKTLLTKELVYERGRPLKRYALTDEGWEVARRIKELARPGTGAGSGTTAPFSTRPSAPPAPAPVPAPVPAPARAPARRAPSESLFVSDNDDDDDIVEVVDDFNDDDLGQDTVPQDRKNEYINLVGDGNATSNDSASLPSFTPITLPPGSFTVELLLDNREVRAKADRDYMREELAKRGVKPTVRPLELGDALWVARCKELGYLSRHGAEGEEVMLDWIVERKRLDDLVGSIKDGRFHEQKFRLRRSGVRNVVYIVEEISMDMAVYQRHEEAINSAMASMQVVNGYFVKRTAKMDDTIRYLASMTQMLRTLYEGKPLKVIPTRVLTTRNYLPLLKHLRETQPAASHHVSYLAFASLASKSSNMALRDLFLKMLMCTRGVTGEKAIEIQKVWKTPYEFIKAFEACGQGEEGRKRRAALVANRLNHLVGRKKISKPVSQALAEVWGEV